jgi:uncharacterized protein (DUF2141 family)
MTLLLSLPFTTSFAPFTPAPGGGEKSPFSLRQNLLIMMKKMFFSAVFALFAVVFSAFLPTRNTGDLRVSVSALPATDGKVYLLIYNAASGFPSNPDKAYRVVSKSPEAQTTTLTVDNLPHGRYAIVAFHDRNGNTKMDKSFWGSPREPYGFSNIPGEFCGTPSFEQTAVTFDAQNTALSIKLIQP